MKTLSVKQVAECLGVSSRAVLKRLSNGQLKGTRRKNKYGVEEWWIYPNKEIRESLESAGKTDLLSSADSISDAEVIEAFQEDFSPDEPEEFDASPNNVRATTAAAAEELWNNIISKFLGELKERDQLIGEMRNEIGEKDRQLRLLPDLQKQAESERLAAENKALEIEALKKQISAMEEKQGETIEQERRIAEEAKLKAADSSKQAEELAAEMALIKSQKEAETKAIQEQLAALTAQLQELKQPKLSWWQKWFAPGGE